MAVREAEMREKMKIVKKAKDDPVYFSHEILGDRLWKMQKEILRASQKNDIAVASCHGAGKSFIASRIVLHGLTTEPKTQIITTAPTNRQVKKILWKEIRTAHSRSQIELGGEALTQELRIDDDWFAIGFATSDSNQFQGFHGANIIVVADEAAGVDEEIFEGIEGVTSSANSRRIYIGNPTTRSGTFFDSFKNSNFETFHISAFDLPNFTAFGITYEDIINNTWKEKVTADLPFPMLTGPSWVAERYEKWGPESALFQAKVLGKFPKDEEYTAIPLYIWTDGKKEIEKWPEIEDIREVKIGVDVARFGDDLSVIAINIKNHLVDMRTFSKLDTTAVANWVDRIVRSQFNTHRNWKNIEINIDVTGVGSGVVDRLRNVKGYKNINGIHFSGKAKDDEQYVNKRAEMYWELRENLKNGSYKICVFDESLENEITSIKYEFSKDRVKMESKKKVKKRLKKSPDKSDATCLAFYEDKGANKNSALKAWMEG